MKIKLERKKRMNRGKKETKGSSDRSMGVKMEMVTTALGHRKAGLSLLLLSLCEHEESFEFEGILEIEEEQDREIGTRD